MRVFENVNLTKTIQLWPRSKKRRIRKKWMKNPAKKRIEPDLNCYALGNDIHCHPVVAAQLRRSVKEQARSDCGEPTVFTKMGWKITDDNDPWVECSSKIIFL